MDQKILEYIKTQRLCVMAVEMLDGSPHAATLHFAHTENPLMFFFETNRDYRKCAPLFGRATTRASVVIGFDESNVKTLQMDGVVRLLHDNEQTVFDAIYFPKFPDKKKKVDSKFVPFAFIPTWWRFTDWTRPDGKVIFSSDQL